MIFGKEKNKGIKLGGSKLEVVTIGEDGVTEADLLVHDETDERLALHACRYERAKFPCGSWSTLQS